VQSQGERSMGLDKRPSDRERIQQLLDEKEQIKRKIERGW
jgi:hypothetical protein